MNREKYVKKFEVLKAKDDKELIEKLTLIESKMIKYEIIEIIKDKGYEIIYSYVDTVILKD